MQHLYVNVFILTEICRRIAEECQVCWGTSVPARSGTLWDLLAFTNGPALQKHTELTSFTGKHPPLFLFIILR